MRVPTPCTAADGLHECGSHLPGHVLQRVHSKLLGRTPWGWCDGVVTTVEEGGWLTVETTEDVAPVRAWHHRDLRAALRPATRVRVHARHQALAGPLGVLSLVVPEDAHPVPEPVQLDVWAQAVPAPVIDLRTGAVLDPGALQDDPELLGHSWR